MKAVLESNLTIQILNDFGYWIYEIDLERCTGSAGVLDYLFQIFHKSWLHN